MQHKTNTTAPPSSTRTLTIRGVRPESIRRTPTVPVGTTPAYFYVWAPEKARPKIRHATLEAADVEATRLAALNPGVRYDIFAAYCVGKRLVSP